MGLLLDVGHAVIVEVGGSCEALAAHFTHVRLLSSVNPPVRVQTRAGGESFVAEVTLIRSLPRVNPDVPLQQAGSVKLLPTSITWQESF